MKIPRSSVAIVGLLIFAVPADSAASAASDSQDAGTGLVMAGKPRAGLTFSARRHTVKERVDTLLDRMTVEEMIGQLNLQPYYEKNDSAIRAAISRGEIGALLKADGAALNGDLQRLAVSSSRLGIPIMFHEDVIHGYRTIFPIPLAEACSWDVGQVERNSRAIAREAAAAGLQLTYAPMVDVCSDGRWGRIMETSGEDPYLDAEMAAARVRGFQGQELSDRYSIMACVKHFAGYACMKDGMDYRNEEFSVRDLEEIYLPPYRACVRENVGSFMCSYTMYDGIPATHSHYLNTEVLRGELGYDGLLMTDWSTLSHAYAEGAAESKKQSAELGINSGIDMDMKSGYFVTNLKQLCDEGKVSMERIREAAGRALEMKFKMGLFDDPFSRFNESEETAELRSDSCRKQALEAACASMVLLKNDGVLPLAPGTAVNVCGPFADAREDLLGPWKCQGVAEETESIAEAVAGIFTVRPSSKVSLVCIGESASLAGEAKSGSSLELEKAQTDLLLKLKRRGNTVIAVLLNGRPLCLSDIVDNCDAILEAWYPGSEGGKAVAQILSGQVNPSGKLVQTFPRHAGQLPMNYYPRRTFQKISRSGVEDGPLFPFGYGLGYTSFDYSAPELSSDTFTPGTPVTVTVEVRNTGSRDGDEIVQLYVADEAASVIPREMMLRAFRKVHIEKGGSRKVTFTLDDSAFSIYAADHKWKIEPGTFKIMVGSSSASLQSAEITSVKKTER